MLGCLRREPAGTGEVGRGGRVPEREHVRVVARSQRIVDDQPSALHPQPDLRDERRGCDARRPHNGPSRERFARNVAASLENREARASRHRDLGFAVDLTGGNAIATPLGVRLSGALAKLAGRAYQLLALLSGRLRVLSDWVNALVGGPQIIELGLIDERYATIQAEASGGGELAIARRLVLAERTVEGHVRSVLMKLDLPERQDPTGACSR